MNSEKSENFSKKSVLILLMSKIGFQLKASSKRKRISVEKEKDHDGKELILSIEGSVIKSEKINGKNSLLVIPLINKVEKSIKAQSSIEALAAAELIADARNCGSDSKSSTLTIGIGENKGPGSTWTPILLANQSSELVGIKDEGERFKVDVSLRPPELDVNSDSYKTVPVEEFGAALLRGMGWNGVSTDEANKKKDTKLFPREYRLGLGATPKPSSTNGAGNKGKNKNETTITNDRDWSKKAEEFLKTQALRIGDLVWLRDPLFANRRAHVIATTNIPGLNKIRVKLESDGKVVDVKRLDAVLVTDEAAAAPEESKNDRYSGERAR